MDTIYRQDAIAVFGDIHPMDYNAQAYVNAIKALPSAQPEPKTGKWLSQVGGGYCCSKCGRYALHDVDEKFALLFTKSKYCPHCGAKMEGEDKG